MSATWLRDWCIFYKAKTVFADVSNRNKLHHATCDINIRADFVGKFLVLKNCRDGY